MDWIVIVLWAGAIIISVLAAAGEFKKKKLRKAQIAELEARLKGNASVEEVKADEQ